MRSGRCETHRMLRPIVDLVSSVLLDLVVLVERGAS